MAQKKVQPNKALKRHSTYLGWGILALILSYFVGSRAFDTGSWWEYLATLTLFILGIKELILSIKPKQ
jgi:hypothetical protein